MLKPAPGLTIEQQPEAVLFRMCVWAEARGESALGKLAVAWTLMNRSIHWKQPLAKVVLAPWQFSSFNENDPNRAKLLLAHADRQWEAVDAVCELLESKAALDPTLGATHYYNPKVANPDWGEGHPKWVRHIQIGNHLFGIAA